MKFAWAAVGSTLLGAADAKWLRRRFPFRHSQTKTASAAAAATSEKTNRNLQVTNIPTSIPTTYVPTTYVPTLSPTESELDVYYADYDNTSWPEGFCVNTSPLPSGRTTYDTMLECCIGAYGGQVSGICLSMLPSPPTASPTETGDLDVFYPDYDTPWPEAGCINTRPLPSGRPTYDTMLECCNDKFGGQISGMCLAMLPSPPTASPTETGDLDVFYPDTDTPWSEAGCINTRPLPSGRPTYDTMLECCNAEYGGQISGACISMLPSPPTGSPTQ